MTLFITFVTIIQSFSISLGVGCSTLAVLNFFAAIRDGIIDDTERRMMGVVYQVLRVAMVVILLTTTTLVGIEYNNFGLERLSALSLIQLLILLVLYLNAVLMTLHMIPSTFGPAIQAGSWYTLGTLSALLIVGYVDFTFIQFLLGYLSGMILAVGIINGAMAIIKEKH